MTLGLIEASWTFVQSPTYTAISITVGLIVSIFLAALVIQQELLQGPGGSDGRPRRPHGKPAMVPLLLCFGVIVILRLATLAYRRPDTTSTDRDSSTHQPTAAPMRAAAAAKHPTAAGVGVFSKSFLADDRSIARVQAYNNIDHPTTHAVGAYVALFSGANDSATRARSSPPTLYCEVPSISPKRNSGSFGLGVAASRRIAGELCLSRNLATLAPDHRTVLWVPMTRVS